ncbi:hypothetical protein C2S53_003476 [Perilla frutescens var. hirtella]|uniref:Uncharacterized protein n=1 Tax=Perilla frutescens var. hirtella TaxID=608512 RepID=A0AAD4IP86_PERFH|nr:hypothetical protein C2S53_003476 [Perilla frutescens var. hirtella]
MADGISLNSLEAALKKSEYNLQTQILQREAWEFRLQEQIKDFATQFDQISDGLAAIQLQLQILEKTKEKRFGDKLVETRSMTESPTPLPLLEKVSAKIGITPFNPYKTELCKSVTPRVGTKLEGGLEGNMHSDALNKCWTGLELGKYAAGIDFSEDKDIIDDHKVFDEMPQREIRICSRKEEGLIASRPLPKPPPPQRHFKEMIESAMRKILFPSSIEFVYFYTGLLYEAANDAIEYNEVIFTIDAWVSLIRSEVCSLIKKLNTMSIFSSWRKNMCSRDEIFWLIPIRRDHQDSMELGLVLARMPDERRNMIKTSEERVQEINIRVGPGLDPRVWKGRKSGMKKATFLVDEVSGEIKGYFSTRKMDGSYSGYKLLSLVLHNLQSRGGYWWMIAHDEQLYDRISNGTLADDERIAMDGAFVARDFLILLIVLSIEESVVTKLRRESIATLLSVLILIHHSKSLKNKVQSALVIRELMSSKEVDNIYCLLSHLSKEDFYIWYYMLTVLLTNSPTRLHETIPSILSGDTRFVDMLLDREVINNNDLLLLTFWTYEVRDILNTLIFEGAFEKIIGIINEAGGSEGVVIQDCLELLCNLLRNNTWNPTLLKETVGFSMLMSILKIRRSTFKFRQHKIINLLSVWDTISLLLRMEMRKILEEMCVRNLKIFDDPNFQGCGNSSTGDIYHAAPDIDHSQDFVGKAIKKGLQHDIGFDGCCPDLIGGYVGGSIKEHIECSNLAVVVMGEWKPTGVRGRWISHAITFLENMSANLLAQREKTTVSILDHLLCRNYHNNFDIRVLGTRLFQEGSNVVNQLTAGDESVDDEEEVSVVVGVLVDPVTSG